MAAKLVCSRRLVSQSLSSATDGRRRLQFDDTLDVPLPVERVEAAVDVCALALGASGKVSQGTLGDPIIRLRM